MVDDKKKDEERDNVIRIRAPHPTFYNQEDDLITDGERKKKKADIVELFDRHTLPEVQKLVKEWYELHPDIFLLLSAHKEYNEDGTYEYNVAHIYHTCEGQDLIELLGDMQDLIRKEIGIVERGRDDG